MPLEDVKLDHVFNLSVKQAVFHVNRDFLRRIVKQTLSLCTVNTDPMTIMKVLLCLTNISYDFENLNK